MSLNSSRASSPFDLTITGPPMDQIQELEGVKGTQHSQYYFEDGNIVFQVEDTLYNVHRYFFARDSPHFQAIFQGTDAVKPCVLSGVNCADFDEFLAILYPTDFRRPTKKTTAQWISVLHLAAEWDFANIKLLAIDNLTATATPIDKIVLGRRHGITDWLPGAYEAVCTRADPLNLEEGMRLGVEDTVRISAARQLYGTCKARYETGCLAGDLGDIFSLEKSTEGNSLSMDGEEKVINILEGQVMEARAEYLATPTLSAVSCTDTANTYNPDYYRGYIDVPRRGSIPEHLPIGIAAGDGETVPAACPVPPFPENISPLLSPLGGTSPNTKDTLGLRQELTAIVLKVKSNSTAAVASTFDPSATHLPKSIFDLSATHLPMSTALENPPRHESQSSSARSPTRQELTCEHGPQNAISPVDIESQGNRVDTEYQGRRAGNSETGQEENIKDGNDYSVKELTPKQKRVLQCKMKKEKEDAKQVKKEREDVKSIGLGAPPLTSSISAPGPTTFASTPGLFAKPADKLAPAPSAPSISLSVPNATGSTETSRPSLFSAPSASALVENKSQSSFPFVKPPAAAPNGTSSALSFPAMSAPQTDPAKPPMPAPTPSLNVPNFFAPKASSPSPVPAPAQSPQPVAPAAAFGMKPPTSAATSAPSFSFGNPASKPAAPAASSQVAQPAAAAASSAFGGAKPTLFGGSQVSTMSSVNGLGSCNAPLL